PRVVGLHGADGRELLRIITIGVRAVLCVIDFFHQAGMGDGNVIALEVVVDVDLPVAVDDVVAALGKFQSFKIEAAHLSRNFAENFFERLGVVVKIYEDEIAPSVEAQRKHAHGAAIEKFDALDVGRADEFSFEGVSPAMVLAAHDVLAAAAERDGTSTVAADVAEGAQSS